jgi:hypothetical protein
MLSLLRKWPKTATTKEKLPHFASIVLLWLFCFLQTACATIINGRTQKVTVTSDPPGAIVSDGEGYWTTPTTVSLLRKEDHPLFIWKPGYKVQSYRLKHVASYVILGDALLPGGLVFLAIDVATGSEFTLAPGEIHVKLRPMNEKEIELYPAPL